MRQLESYSDQLSAIKTKTLRNLILKDERIVAFTIETDGVFIYTNYDEWCDEYGAGIFRADSETGAVRDFKENVIRAASKTSGEA